MCVCACVCVCVCVCVRGGGGGGLESVQAVVGRVFRAVLNAMAD